MCIRDRGIEIEIAFTKNFGAGLFGGEGFILQRLEGDGLAFCLLYTSDAADEN